MLVVCLVCSLVCLFVHPRRIGGWEKVTVPQAQIENIAQQFLRKQGVTEGDWKVSSSLTFYGEGEELQYLFEKLGFQKTNEVVRQVSHPLIWLVRFYKPEQKREYLVGVTSVGRPVWFDVTDEENAEGKKIDQKSAQQLADDFLKTYRPELAPLQFDTAAEQKRKNRTDYTVSYVVPSLKIADARLKVEVDTVGGYVSNPRVGWDVPDAWSFERKKLTIKDQIAKVVSPAVLVILAAFGIYWAVGVFRAQAIHWRPVLITAGALGIATMLSHANGFVANLFAYDTEMPYLSYLTQLGVNGLIQSILYAAIYAGMFAIGHGAFRIICPGVSGQSLWHSTIKPPPERRLEAKVLWLDGAFSAYTWLLVVGAVSSLAAYVEGKFSPEVAELSMSTLTSLTQYSFPTIEQISNALCMGFACVCLAPVAVGVYLKYFRSYKRFLIFAFLILLLVDCSTKYWQDYVREVAFGFIDFAVIYYWIKHCARNNPLAYFIAGAANTLFVAMYYIFKYSTNIYTIELFLLSAFFVMPLFIPLVFRAARPVKKSEA
jgi:hypothetical protein